MTQNREVKCENRTGIKAVTNREVVNAQGFKAPSFPLTANVQF